MPSSRQTPSIMARVYQTLVERGSVGLQDLIQILSPLKRKQIRNALERLRLTGHVQVQQNIWSIPVNAQPVEKPKAPVFVMTPEDLQSVEACCTGKQLREIKTELAHLDKFYIKQMVAHLRGEEKIHYVSNGWIRTDLLPIHRPDQEAVKALLRESEAWMRYWHPSNRAKRLQERICQ